MKMVEGMEDESILWPKGEIGNDVATPLWGKCEDETHTPKSGNLESFGTPVTSKLNCRGQNTSPRSVFNIGKGLEV